MSKRQSGIGPSGIPANTSMKSKPQELVFPGPGLAAESLAGSVAEQLRAGLGERGCASLIVSGGKSPIPFFKALSTQALDWSRVVISLADERWVEPDSPDSNERLVREHLLVAAAGGARFVPLKNAAASPQAGLAAARTAYGRLPRPFDVVVLGMGEDGHTASLFPGWPGLAAALDPANADRLVAVDPPSAAHARLSFTMSALLEARRLYLQIEGEQKQRVYTRARDGSDSTEQLPIAAILRQTEVPLSVYLANVHA